MIKILVINTVRFHTNGMSNIIIDFYQNMDRSNISVDFVVNEIIEKKYEKVIHDHKDKCFILKHRNKIPFFYIHELSKLIRNNDYDIIHIHGNSALMSVELKAIQKSGSIAKVIVHAHNTSCTHLLLNRILYGYFSKHYDYALACSDAAGKWLYKKHPYIVLNNGIDEQRFQYNPEVRDRYRKKYCIEDRFVVTHVGRFNEQKNHTFLIEIFKQVHKKNPFAVLRLVGTGELMDSIKKKVKDKGLSDYVVFVGKTDHTEIEYQIADVFVLPSLYESFGLVNVEAQCAGLPCVISDTVPKEIRITERVQFLSLQSSPEIWADAILANDHLSRNSHHEEVISNHYSIKKEALKLSDLYRSILKKTSDKE